LSARELGQIGNHQQILRRVAKQPRKLRAVERRQLLQRVEQCRAQRCIIIIIIVAIFGVVVVVVVVVGDGARVSTQHVDLRRNLAQRRLDLAELSERRANRRCTCQQLQPELFVVVARHKHLQRAKQRADRRCERHRHAAVGAHRQPARGVVERCVDGDVHRRLTGFARVKVVYDRRVVANRRAARVPADDLRVGVRFGVQRHHAAMILDVDGNRIDFGMQYWKTIDNIHNAARIGRAQQRSNDACLPKKKNQNNKTQQKTQKNKFQINN
jgi:hypothetical protein